MRKLKVFLVLLASITLLSISGCTASKTFVEQPMPTDGIMVPGENLADHLAWLEINAESRRTYILQVKADEDIVPHTIQYRGILDVVVIIQGIDGNRTLRLASDGTMFTVKPKVIFVLGDNITLMGHSQNTGPMVNVDGGTFLMRSGSRISSNDRGSGDGGGVYVGSGIFEMTGGTISGNTAENGGGIYVANGLATILSGIISDNTANSYGGGVYCGSFRYKQGSNGQQFVESGFNMGNYGILCNGMITKNTARKRGGGLYVNHCDLTGTLNPYNSGIITGYESDSNDGNVVRNEAGKVLSQKGHAVAFPEHCTAQNQVYLRDKTVEKKGGFF